MTTLTHHTCVTRPSRPFSLLRVIARIQRVWTSRRALARLDPAQLDDVGITPIQAHHEARRAVWDVPANWRD